MKEDKGAKCFFIPGIEQPLLLVKRDGGFNYDSTDMAAINYRFNTLHADRCIYITDKGQEFHFKQIFEAAYHCGIINKEKHRVDHMGFGLV